MSSFEIHTMFGRADTPDVVCPTAGGARPTRIANTKSEPRFWNSRREIVSMASTILCVIGPYENRHLMPMPEELLHNRLAKGAGAAYAGSVSGRSTRPFHAARNQAFAISSIDGGGSSRLSTGD